MQQESVQIRGGRRIVCDPFCMALSFSSYRILMWHPWLTCPSYFQKYSSPCSSLFFSSVRVAHETYPIYLGSRVMRGGVVRGAGLQSRSRRFWMESGLEFLIWLQLLKSNSIIFQHALPVYFYLLHKQAVHRLFDPETLGRCCQCF